MPMYVYRFPDGREQDEFYATWRNAPDRIEVDGEIGRRVPAPVRMIFSNPVIQEKAAQGLVPVEPGMERDAARARAEREQRATDARRQYLRDALAGA